MKKRGIVVIRYGNTSFSVRPKKSEAKVLAQYLTPLGFGVTEQ